MRHYEIKLDINIICKQDKANFSEKIKIDVRENLALFGKMMEQNCIIMKNCIIYKMEKRTQVN